MRLTNVNRKHFPGHDSITDVKYHTNENALGIELYDRSGGSLGTSGKGTLNQC